MLKTNYNVNIRLPRSIEKNRIGERIRILSVVNNSIPLLFELSLSISLSLDYRTN